MSIPILAQVYDEVRRLAIAGSTVAPNDFRLKKLLPPLAKAGEKAPIFAKVAESVTSLIESNEKTAPQALLETSTLISAILYTQGETGIEGKLEPIETVDLGAQQTQARARVLKPLLEALNNTGSGRLEIIKDAHERGAFRDLRLVKPALAALDDPYPEIGDFIAENVLPLYGRAILPELRARFDPKGRGGHVRRLALMHQLDADGSREIVKKALDEGSKEVRVAAIECLGDASEDTAYLLEQTRSKAKEVRQAALRALAKSDAADAVAALHAALAGGDIDLAVEPVRRSTSPKLRELVLAEAETQLAALLAAKGAKEKDKKAVGKQVERMLSLLECLRGRDDKGAESLLLKCFQERDALGAIKGEPSGNDLRERLVWIMAGGPKKAQQALVDQHASLRPEELAEAFQAARRSRKPAEVYDLFSPYLTAKVDEKKKARDPAYARREAICDALTETAMRRCYSIYDAFVVSEVADTPLPDLDQQWLDLAIRLQNSDLVCTLARPGHKAASEYLHKTFAQTLSKSKDLIDCNDLLRALIRIEHPAATDSLIAALHKHLKGNRGHYVDYWIAELIPELPKQAVPQLEALLPTLPEKTADRLLDYVTQLKTKN